MRRVLGALQPACACGGEEGGRLEGFGVRMLQQKPAGPSVVGLLQLWERDSDDTELLSPQQVVLLLK